MKNSTLKILSNVKVSERYWHMALEASSIVDEITAGQFFNIKCGDKTFPILRRPFSIYRINKDERTIEFLYLVKGEGTIELTKLKAGEHIELLGPLGNGFRLEETWSTILLLARGVGIATLAALAQEANEMNIKCVAILSARINNDLLATETLQSLGAEVYKVTEEDNTSDVENVEKIINEIIQTHRIDSAFTCGSKRLSKLLQRKSKEFNIPSQIALEEHMGCAMGVCYACVCDIKENDEIKSVRVCHEGPVFGLEKVILK